jgi:hypothetical protein
VIFYSVGELPGALILTRRTLWCIIVWVSGHRYELRPVERLTTMDKKLFKMINDLLWRFFTCCVLPCLSCNTQKI